MRVVFPDLRLTSHEPCHTFKAMTPLGQAVIVACIVAITAVLVPTLLALKKVALRAESVLDLIEREIRPMASQMESLAGELSHHANQELERVGVVVRRLEELSVKVTRLVGALSVLTRVGQYAGIVTGIKKGLDVFIRRLKDKDH